MKRNILPVVVALALIACNQHPVSKALPAAGVEFRVTTPVAASEKLDILWVIDNSGSMCQEQAILRENFDRFVAALDETIVDFHIGVTTTHMKEGYPPEPVARPGHLQSTPQPLPGFDRTCWTATDVSGESIPGDFTPVRQLMEAAVGCMATPDPSFLDHTDSEIECALNCQYLGRCTDTPCDAVALFPDPTSYRQIDKVLRADDYRADDGNLDVAALKADFACMSLVGMRGYGFEKGLGALVEAVSPELTGGTEDNPLDPSAPNFGFVRSDARFAAVFVTDENDCTHDGGLSEVQGACLDDLCDYWNHPDAVDSPLLDPAVLRDAMIANLAATKAEPEFDIESSLVASIHGQSRRYDGPVVPNASCRADGEDDSADCAAFDVCDDPAYTTLPPTCATSLGSAYSGDRYERFLTSFGAGHYFPPANEDGAIKGWMCSGDFKPALEAIGEFLRAAPEGCITRPILSCEPGGSSCPSHADGQPGACVARPNSNEFFCTSYVQLRVSGDAARVAQLEASGFCGASGEGDCVVSPSQYSLAACDGTVSGVRVSWADPTGVRQTLAGTELEVLWVSY